jgi:hypothetical protein
MPDNFLLKENINTKNLIALIILFCLSFCFYILYESNQNSKDYRDLISLYNTGGALALYLFFYKAQRNLYVFILLVILGIFHFVFYLKIKGDLSLVRNHHDMANCFRNTIFFVLFFQVLRFVSFQTQYQDLIAPAKFDLAFDDDRKATLTDINLFVVFFTFVVILTLN